MSPRRHSGNSAPARVSATRGRFPHQHAIVAYGSLLQLPLGVVEVVVFIALVVVFRVAFFLLVLLLLFFSFSRVKGDPITLMGSASTNTSEYMAIHATIRPLVVVGYMSVKPTVVMHTTIYPVVHGDQDGGVGPGDFLVQID
jgi:hypothetical protein